MSAENDLRELVGTTGLPRYAAEACYLANGNDLARALCNAKERFDQGVASLRHGTGMMHHAAAMECYKANGWDLDAAARDVSSHVDGLVTGSKGALDKEEARALLDEIGWDLSMAKETMATRLAAKAVPADWPDGWSPPASGQSNEPATVKITGSPEADVVLAPMFQSWAGRGLDVEVRDVYRIQNHFRWKQYQMIKDHKGQTSHTGHKDDDAAHAGASASSAEVAWLFHGTTKEGVEGIVQNGVNHSYAGENVGSAYGKGAYFAKEAVYSTARQYARPDSNGVQRIFACRVCVGTPCRGRRDMKEPDKGCDSACDEPSNPQIYVTFFDNEAYPEYVKHKLTSLPFFKMVPKIWMCFHPTPSRIQF